MMITRHLAAGLLDALADSPAVFLQGARQTGKSTLVQSLAERGHRARYITFDDATVLAAATGDPQAFIAGLEGAVILDEVQRAPQVAMAIKKAIDAQRSPGRFLLTGSANALFLPRLSESLAGRMEVLTLWPFSQGELAGHRETFIDDVFARRLVSSCERPATRRDVIARLLLGGYPEVAARSRPDRREAWFGSYVSAILQRDIRDMANIEGLTQLPRLLALLATRAATLLNHADLARNLGMPQTTLKRYMALLSATFLIREIPAWAPNLGKRLLKSPRLMLNDTGLIAHLLAADADRLEHQPALAGALLENFVAMELTRQNGWSRRHPTLLHFRTAAGQEVDLVLEDRDGRLVGIEVKAGPTVRDEDFQGLRVLAELAGDRFLRGIVLHTGAEFAAFGDRLAAVNIARLWS